MQSRRYFYRFVKDAKCFIEYREGLNWNKWVSKYQTLIEQTTLPKDIFISPETWWHFLDCDPHFDVDKLNLEEKLALDKLLNTVLSEHERSWRNTVWYTIHPVNICNGFLYYSCRLVPGQIIALLDKHNIPIQINTNWRCMAYPDISADDCIIHIDIDKIPFELRAINMDVWIIYPPVIKYAGAISNEFSVISRNGFDYPNFCPLFNVSQEVKDKIIQNRNIIMDKQESKPWWKFW
ncbi:MAG: hypothetical protein KI793_28295 [Rivularia sp. (in: Bacteria)]|nr:hypothetical protein [Rivularia sp. MS3]